MVAVKKRDYDAIRALLLEKQVHPDAEGRSRTPLNQAVEMGDQRSTQQLLSAQANPYRLLYDGDSPFLLAVKKNNFPIVRVFLGHKNAPKCQLKIAQKLSQKFLKMHKYLSEQWAQKRCLCRHVCFELLAQCSLSTSHSK